VIDATAPEVERYIHRLVHLQARRGLYGGAEACMVSDQCWSVLDGPPPTWAIDLANAGEPGSQWCPIISPDLRRRP
jgi:hypothetical protein